MLRQAVEHHRAGRLDAAEKLYRRVIDGDPDNSDALNLLGVIALGRAQYGEAKMFFQRAVAAGPLVPDVHFNFGNLLATTGEFDAAVMSYTRAIELSPDHLRGHVSLSQCLLSLRRFDEAISILKKAEKIEPANADIQLLLSNASADIDRLQDALLHIRRAIALNPTAEYYSTLGDLLCRAQNFDDALIAHQAAMARKPEDPAILYNYGASLHAAKRLDEAAKVFLQALERSPGFIKAYIGLAKVYEHRGQFDLAVRTLRDALSRDPASADIRFKLSVLQLAAGDFAEGWANYAYRMADSKALYPRRASPPSYWSGENLAGKNILVWTEQGLGDEILHAGMIPDIVAQAGSCVIECSPRLMPVFARSFPTAKVVAYQRPNIAVTSARDVDYQIAAGDLGRFVRADFAVFPHHLGYLKADLGRAALLRERYGAVARGNLLVGLAWRSSNKEVGALKSATLVDWGALLSVPGVTFVNLQYGDCTAELAAVRSSLGVDIVWDRNINPLEKMDDFFDQVAAMDLVISTSNTTVHVAGSLNVPVWLIDAAGPGALWYWFRAREDSPWYPAMRIFRNKKQRLKRVDGPWWRQNIEAVAEQLGRRVATALSRNTADDVQVREPHLKP